MLAVGESWRARETACKWSEAKGEWARARMPRELTAGVGPSHSEVIEQAAAIYSSAM